MKLLGLVGRRKTAVNFGADIGLAPVGRCAEVSEQHCSLDSLPFTTSQPAKTRGRKGISGRRKKYRALVEEPHSNVRDSVEIQEKIWSTGDVGM